MKRKICKVISLCLMAAMIMGILSACHKEPFIYSSSNENGLFENNFFSVSYDEKTLALAETQPKEGEKTALVSLYAANSQPGKESTPRIDILNVELDGLTVDTPTEDFVAIVTPIIKAYYSDGIRDKITFKEPSVSVTEHENALVCDLTLIAEEYKEAHLPEITFDIKIKGVPSTGVIILFIHKDTEQDTKVYQEVIDSIIVK